ncbi:hypothetical protein HOY80DRAFT_1134283 [Tuber brumale]|nr:hypothetical protein HOY80DRAFT_1134283 [Tuber brumale]
MSSFFGCQPIEQLWSQLNPNGLVLAIIEIGARMSFLDVAYARSTILEDYIRNADKLNVAFRSGIHRCTGTRNETNPTIVDFDISLPDGEINTPIRSPYTTQQLYNYTLTVLLIILPPMQTRIAHYTQLMHSDGAGKIMGFPQEPQKIGVQRHVEEQGGKTESKFVAIKGPHSDGVRAIVKYKPAALLKAKKARRLQRKPDARERHLEMVRVQKERRGMGLQGKESTVVDGSRTGRLGALPNTPSAADNTQPTADNKTSEPTAEIKTPWPAAKTMTTQSITEMDAERKIGHDMNSLNRRITEDLASLTRRLDKRFDDQTSFNHLLLGLFVCPL